jgi:pimeloyl-ACP methyl ester carboxylesterase
MSSAGQAATEQTDDVSVDGGALSAEACGEGPSVLLIHRTAPAAWGELPALLSLRCRVITYDRRSFGTARASRPPNLTTHATDPAAVIRATCAPATSWAGALALSSRLRPRQHHLS